MGAYEVKMAGYRSLLSTAALSLLLCMGLVTPCKGQVAETGVTTLRTSGRLVVVDVVVTDKQNRRVHNLAREDFRLRENNQPQAITSFEEHVAGAPVPAKAEMLAPGTFSNRQEVPTGAALNVILLDTLNTPAKDQPYLAKQVAAYLGSLPAGTPLAVFGLNQRLAMLQGFTSDPAILQHLLDGQLPNRSFLSTDAEEENSPAVTILDEIGSIGMADYLPQNVQVQIQNFSERLAAGRSSHRNQVTLDGMNALAQYLSSIPGRKNLIWFSGGFTVDLLPQYVSQFRRPKRGSESASYDPFAGAFTSERELRETVNLMTRAQVAIYPIDSRGLMTSSSYSSANTVIGHDVDRLGNNESDFGDEIYETHNTMDRLASETGGRAFYNTNNLSAALRSAVGDGAEYYTLTYSPAKGGWKGDLRKIAVELSRKDLKLSYRHTYYADDPASPTSALKVAGPIGDGEVHGVLEDHSLTRAMENGTPPATQLLFELNLHPEDALVDAKTVQGKAGAKRGSYQAHGKLRRVLVLFALDPETLKLERLASGNYSGILELRSAVFTRTGQVVSTASNQYQVSIKADRYAEFRAQKMPVRQEVSVPLDEPYSVRAAVLDINASKVGSLEVSSAKLKDLPLVPALQPGDSPKPGLVTRPHR